MNDLVCLLPAGMRRESDLGILKDNFARCNFSMSNEHRQSKRIVTKKRASLIARSWDLTERSPCLIVDTSQDGFRLRVTSKLRRGQVVEVSVDEDPGDSTRCSVVWVGKPGSKQEGEAGLQSVGAAAKK